MRRHVVDSQGTAWEVAREWFQRPEARLEWRVRGTLRSARAVRDIAGRSSVATNVRWSTGRPHAMEATRI
jgi:hypothetical protein